MKWMEKSKRSHFVRMKHEDDYGMNEDSNLSQSVRASNKEDSQRTTTLTDSKKERLRKRRIFNAWRLMHWHQLRSHVHQVFQVISHIVGMRSVIRVVNSIVVAVTIYSIFDLDANFLLIHSAKTGLLRSCLYSTFRLQQTALSCERSNCNNIEKKTKNRESRSSEVLSKDGTQQVSLFYHIALHVSSLYDFLLIIVSSTRNHSIGTNWRKNSMIGAIADTSRMELAWVVVHQNLGVDGLM